MPKVTERVREEMMIQRQGTGIHSVFMSLWGVLWPDSWGEIMS